MSPAPSPRAQPITSVTGGRRVVLGLTIALAVGVAGCGAAAMEGSPGDVSGGENLGHDPTALAAAAGNAPDVAAESFAVYDASTGNLLAAQQANDRRAVGSLMKLLNAYVAYDAGDPEKEIVAPDGLGGDKEESVIGISAGQEVSRAVAIRAMLKVSANDAARLLAFDIAGSEDAYAELMNDAASALGLTNTHAVNASGLDGDGQYSSANDLITLGADLMSNEAFAATVSETSAQFNGQAFPNTNDLLATYAGADGIKTGHTDDAGWCILASATRDGRRIIVAVLGAPSEDDRNQAATALLDWAFG